MIQLIPTPMYQGWASVGNYHIPYQILLSLPANRERHESHSGPDMSEHYLLDFGVSFNHIVGPPATAKGGRVFIYYLVSLRSCQV